MRALVTWTTTLALLLAGAGCGEDPGIGSRAADASGPVEADDARPAPRSFLDGTWEARITREAFLRYMADHDVRRPAALAAAERDHPGEDFSVRFLQGMFNVTGPTGESWHQGDFEVHGDELHLWDDGGREAGVPPFRLLITRTGDSVQFEVAPGQDDAGDHIPGVPGLVAGGALWCPAPWEKVAKL